MSQFLLLLVLGCIASISTQVVCASLQLLSRSSPILEDLFCICKQMGYPMMVSDMTEQCFDILYPVHCSVKMISQQRANHVIWDDTCLCNYCNLSLV